MPRIPSGQNAFLFAAAVAGMTVALTGCAAEPAPPVETPATAAAASAPAGAAAAPATAAPAAGARGPVMIGTAKWHFYDGGQLPNQSGLPFGDGGSGEAPGGYTTANDDGTITFDSKEPSNKGTWALSPAVDELPFRTFTFLARVKADDPSDRGFDFDFRFGNTKAAAQGPRVKFILKPNEIQIEKPDGTSGSTQKLRLEGDQYHVYQLGFTVTADNKVVTNIYVDSNDRPVMTVEGNQQVGENRFAFGDMGSNTCKGTIDWLGWSDAGPVLPSALKGKLPAELGDVTAYK